jgi:hypothetical protein
MICADSLGSTVQRPLDQRSTRSTDPDDRRTPARSHGHHRVVHVGIANGTCQERQSKRTASSILYEYSRIREHGKASRRGAQLVDRLLGKRDAPKGEGRAGRQRQPQPSRQLTMLAVDNDGLYQSARIQQSRSDDPRPVPCHPGPAPNARREAS